MHFLSYLYTMLQIFQIFSFPTRQFPTYIVKGSRLYSIARSTITDGPISELPKKKRVRKARRETNEGVAKMNSKSNVLLDTSTNTCLLNTEHFEIIHAVQNSSAHFLSSGNRRKSLESGALEFTVFGEPIPLGRHRVARGIIYNPSAKFQSQFLKESLVHLPIIPLDGPVEATLIFYFSRPKYHFRSGKFESLLKPGIPIWHSKKKDLDNLIKFVLDSLNKKAYIDDGQVVAIHSYKLYTDLEPRVHVCIKKIPDITMEQAIPQNTGSPPERGMYQSH